MCKEYVEENNISDKQLYEETDSVELKAFLEILIAMVIYEDTKDDLNRLWGPVSGKNI